MITPVILSGGSGTRLWPLSTPERPKQFLPLVGEESLFRQTLARVADSQRFAPPIVVANAAHEQLCLQELLGVAVGHLILEPIARNTAVAIAMAAAVAVKDDADAVLLVMPSDHRIDDVEAFQAALERGQEAADRGRLVTFGIEPSSPETGYGYLQAGDADADVVGAWTVARFKEKPHRSAAEEMLAVGGHYWNGGIFMFRADRFLAECAEHSPDVHKSAMAAIDLATLDGAIVRPDEAILAGSPNISIDYAVMERSANISMVPLAAGWSDVGSWDALADLGATGAGDAKVQLVDSAGCYVRSVGPKIALIGAEDLVVVATDEQVVIMKRGRSQEIKRLAAVDTNGG